nr:PREDICTED: cuticlin-1 [Bemisia tabaci]
MDSSLLTPFLAVALLLTLSSAALYDPALTSSDSQIAPDVRVDCSGNEISVAIDTASPLFNGMIYPKGLSKNSSCMAEFYDNQSPVVYKLPLRSCNTMSTQLDDGSVEYFNTIVVQPHRKLVTNQGRGFHIRCRYQIRDKTISNDVNVNTLEPTMLHATAPMPGSAMKIFYGDPTGKEVAENVKIGDPLTLVVSIDAQEAFGLRVTDCLVRDGLGWGEQKLVDKDGCPVDPEIMGPFKYSPNMTTASVTFQAHKFPYTASVYYQCNVQLCVKTDGSCDQVPDCSRPRGMRQRREDSGKEEQGRITPIEVYSGLYVNEATDLGKSDQYDLTVEADPLDDPYNICVSQRSFAIGIAIAGLVLMLLTVLAVLILLTRKRSHKDISTTGSSIYSGPYTNTAYSRSS